MVDLSSVEIFQDEIGWVLKLENPGSRPQEYRCATRQQAEQLAAVLTGNKGKARVSSAPAAKPGEPAPGKPPLKK